MIRTLSVLVLLGACARKPAAAPAPAAPTIVDADCLRPQPLDSPIDAPPPSRAEAVAPGRWLYVEPKLSGATGDPMRDELVQAWVGVEDAAGRHRFWPLADLAGGDHDDGDAEIVGTADVTGDGIPEYLVEVRSRTSSRPGMQVGTESHLEVVRFLWDPVGARTLAAIEVGWGEFVTAPPACDDWCIDGTATTEAEEAAFDCDTCVDASDEGRQDAHLDGDVLVVGDAVRVSGEFSLDTACPPGRFVWAGTGWTRR